MASSELLGIGPLSPPPTGPGIKNRHLKTGIAGHGVSIDWINTLENRAGSVNELLREMRSYDYYVLSVSTNGRFALSPLLTVRLLSDARAVLLPAGGEFADELRNLPPGIRGVYVNIFSRFDAILPQTESMVDDLKQIFGDRIVVRQLPNLRPEHAIERPSDRDPNTIRAVYVGRVKESKGIRELLDAMETIEDTSVDAVLDVYGHFLPDDPYEQRFKRDVERTDSVRFQGELPNEDVIDTLADYDVFVFPTYYDGEGFPGVIVEAFMTGLPVLATDWNYNSEMIVDGYNGRLFDPRSAEDIVENIRWAYQNPDELREMQRNALESSEEYTVENVSRSLINVVEDCGWELNYQ